MHGVVGIETVCEVLEFGTFNKECEKVRWEACGVIGTFFTHCQIRGKAALLVQFPVLLMQDDNKTLGVLMWAGTAFINTGREPFEGICHLIFGTGMIT